MRIAKMLVILLALIAAGALFRQVFDVDALAALPAVAYSRAARPQRRSAPHRAAAPARPHVPARRAAGRRWRAQAPVPQAEDLPWMIDWAAVASQTSKMILYHGLKPGADPDVAAAERNADLYEDQIAASGNFLVR